MKFSLFIVFFIIGACASDTSSPVQKLTSQHGGTLLKGKEHYLEVVLTRDEIKLYPLQDTGKRLEPLPIQGARAKYSSVLSKSDWPVDDLGRRGDALIGHIDAKGDKILNVKVDLLVNGKRESFFQRIPVLSKMNEKEVQ
ncbi:hypothetical protein ACJVC5_18980 [Peredibacter sp. HCB2-198]|uniref:hypothetical protein n=1 Tax=Peredibacter sp. HCB2-198 TaxID=3383025 RepID=UPI0038B59126